MFSSLSSVLIVIVFINLNQVSSQLELWANELERNQNEAIATLSEAETRLSRHNDSVSQMQAAVYQALEQGEQLAQVIKILILCLNGGCNPF